MCGIVFVHRADKKPAQKMILKRYLNQKNRGTQGYGYISINDNDKIDKWRQSEDEKGITKELKEDVNSTIMFHHRMPTSTPNFIEATHPIKVSNENLDKDYYVVHNGIITNCDELKEKHEKKGYKYTTEIEHKYRTTGKIYSEKMFNDSEAFAIELAEVLDGEKKHIDAGGSIAFVALEVDKITQKAINVYFGRNYSNPLKLEESKDFFTISSEGGGSIVPPDTLHIYNLENKVITTAKLDIGKSQYSYDKADYDINKEVRKMGFDTDRYPHIDNDDYDYLSVKEKEDIEKNYLKDEESDIIYGYEENKDFLEDTLYEYEDKEFTIEEGIKYLKSLPPSEEIENEIILAIEKLQGIRTDIKAVNQLLDEEYIKTESKQLALI